MLNAAQMKHSHMRRVPIGFLSYPHLTYLMGYVSSTLLSLFVQPQHYLKENYTPSFCVFVDEGQRSLQKRNWRRGRDGSDWCTNAQTPQKERG